MGKRFQLTLAESPLLPSILAKITKVANKFKVVNLHGVPTLLHYYECSPPPDPEYPGFTVTLRDQPVVYNKYYVELEQYHDNCYKQGGRVVGLDTKVGSWLAGRAVQTRVADQGTTRIRVDNSDHVLGLFVMPVLNRDTPKQTVGIIELVSIVPKESYVDDFVQIHKLLKDEGLDSKGKEKTIKVRYGKEKIIKFTLSISAEFKDLHKEVIERFKTLKHERYSIEYEDTNGNSLLIKSDKDLKGCLEESVSKERTVIKMYVKLET